MSAICGLQDGDILDETEAAQIQAMVNSLSWIVQFCNERPEQFGVGSPDAGAAHEWLANANKLLQDKPSS